MKYLFRQMFVQCVALSQEPFVSIEVHKPLSDTEALQQCSTQIQKQNNYKQGISETSYRSLPATIS